jgi:glycosyltransferase involved in cell wall biosynthesis
MCDLSIIIPVYNGEKTITSVVDSIVDARCDKVSIEIIVVNDGSIDKTAEILDAYLKKCPFLRVLTKENGGVSSARNLGIKSAKGRYILFVDADDTISKLLFQTIEQYLKGDYEIVAFGYNKCKGKHIRPIVSPTTTKNVAKEYLKGVIRFSVWSIVLKKDFVIRNDVWFDEKTYYGEDREFIIRLLLKSSKVVYLGRALYNYQMEVETSATNTPYNIKRFSDLDMERRLLVYSESSDKDIRISVKNLVVACYYLYKRRILKTGDSMLIKRLSDYSDLRYIRPSFQLSKFYFYSLISYMIDKFQRY